MNILLAALFAIGGICFTALFWGGILLAILYIINEIGTRISAPFKNYRAWKEARDLCREHESRW